MKTITCIAIDDEPLALELIQQYAQAFPVLQLLHTFTDAIAAQEYLQRQPVDLIFVDVQMPDITGIDLVRSLVQKPMVVFTTAYKKFAVEGFELDALDYLLKPIQQDRFAKAVQKAVDYQRYQQTAKEEEPASIFVRSEYNLVKIDLAEIEYIESVEDYLKIHRSTGRPVMTLMTLKSILEKLPPQQFKRIHRSYIVPLSKIKSVLNKKVKLTTAELPVSDSYIDVLKAWMRT